MNFTTKCIPVNSMRHIWVNAFLLFLSLFSSLFFMEKIIFFFFFYFYLFFLDGKQGICICFCSCMSNQWYTSKIRVTSSRKKVRRTKFSFSIQVIYMETKKRDTGKNGRNTNRANIRQSSLLLLYLLLLLLLLLLLA